MTRTLLPLTVALLTTAAAGCIGGRYEPQTPASDLDAPTRALVQAISDARTAKSLQPVTWVDELRPAAVRGALGVARGDLSLKTAAYQTALTAVTELGRHVWTFATECPDLGTFRPPPMALQGRALLLGAAVVAAGGKSIVMLNIAEPGPSALRADQMGGGGGGTNPPLQSYAHPVLSSGPCGESWPAPAGARF